MAVLNNSALVGAAGKGGGAAALPQRSLRFSSADTSHLSKTFASAGNRRTWTFSAWVKRGELNTTQYFFGASTDGFNNNYLLLYFGAGNALDLNDYSGAHRLRLLTTQVFRDPSAWYHIVIALDTTQATASNRCKMYVNGTQVTAFQVETYPSQNTDLLLNSTAPHFFGYSNSTYAFNGYIADAYFVENQALTPSDFAYTDPATGRWEPKAYAGSYSGNSFYLDFSDNSAATAAALGADRSGLGNNWVPNNFQVDNGISYTATASASPSGIATFYLPIANLFDGDDNTGASANYAAGDTTDVTVTFNPPIVAGSTLTTRIYQYQTYHSLKVNSGSFVTATGSVVNLLSGHGVSAGSSITSITYRTTSPTPSWALGNTWYYIKNNGVNLLSGASGIDSLRDHPVSAGLDTGLGGQVSGNYCLLSPIQSNGGTLSNGNLEYSTSTGAVFYAMGTIGVSSGKWYFECVRNAGNSAYPFVGVFRQGGSPGSYLGQTADAWTMLLDGSNNGQWRSNDTLSGTTAGAFVDSDVAMIAVDMDAGKIWFGRNGTWAASGNPSTGSNAQYANLTGTVTPAVAMYQSAGVTLNFGARPFAFPAPAGFKCLCDQNLPTPPIIKPANYFDITTWVGTSDTNSTRSFSPFSFSPAFVWIKDRKDANQHTLYDAVRGPSNGTTSKALMTNSQNAEGTLNDDSTYGYLSSFDANGFSVWRGNDGAYVDRNTNGYVAWAWDAGATTVVDNTGSIQSTRRTNAAAGLSIVAWNGNGNATVGHGLGVPPQLIICKKRGGATSDWQVGHASLGWTKRLALNQATGEDTTVSAWNNTAPTSTVFSIGNTSNFGGDIISYCFAPVAGYSAIGKWSGGSDAFVHLGFRPKWLLIKANAASHDWMIFDTSRSPFNVADDWLSPNLANAEQQNNAVNFMDILSNGFKIKGTGGYFGTTADMLYVAFAESPFQYARAR